MEANDRKICIHLLRYTMDRLKGIKSALPNAGRTDDRNLLCAEIAKAHLDISSVLDMLEQDKAKTNV
jgi:hypothetical protein